MHRQGLPLGHTFLRLHSGQASTVLKNITYKEVQFVTSKTPPVKMSTFKMWTFKMSSFKMPTFKMWTFKMSSFKMPTFKMFTFKMSPSLINLP
jgi:hypothetical protein